MRIRIRTKLAAALAVPLVALVVVAMVEVNRAEARADKVRLDAELATAAAGPTSVISRLQDERNYALISLLGMEGTLELPVASTEEARSATDEAYRELQAFVDGSGEVVADAFARTLEALDADLEGVRAAADAYSGPRDLSIGTVTFAEEVYNRYAAFINVIVEDTSTIAVDIDDADLRTGVELISFSTRDLEYSAEISRTIFYQTLTGGSLEEARLDVAGYIDGFAGNRQEIRLRTRGPYAGVAEEFIITDRDYGQFLHYARFVLEGETDLAELSAALGSTEVPGIVAMRSEVSDLMTAQADELVDEALQERNRIAAFSIVAIGLALVVTTMASFSITRPLRSLTHQAESMATETLPRAVQQVLDTPLGEDVVVPDVPPITVKTRDEVADVAEALNTVQRSALDLAVEQAVLRKNIAESFVNLGRRNQELLDRQLDLITDLERRAEDPERLDGLFRLDHLATRMRRNAESLLRLAGGDEILAEGLAAPVPIVDVIRGALGEVEGYQRVDVGALDPALIDGKASADIAHAVAELVENGLNFSPPHEKVLVRGRRSGRGYTIAVADQGVGMSAEQLAVANRRLAGEESFTVAPSRYLGHYVAGHLASTHGVRISLAQEPAGGITAKVELPASVLIEDDGRAGLVGQQAPGEPEADEPEAYEPEAYEPEAYEAEAVEEAANEPDAVEAVAVEETMGEPVAVDEAVVEAEVAEPTAVEPEPEASAARVAPESPDATVFTSAEVTGLTRRIRGANAPKATNVAAAFGGGATGNGNGSHGGGEADTRPASADEVAAFMSALDGGISRGLAEARQSAEREGDEGD